ncbi:Re/Si-specific NAD(P)(+) transhydrogenase subunit alpha [Dasania marina]|uniref:Re/Si-specific NAD(P)(+) transhydrogenase subunit alpha n=1 Tax=Dasania marina TaxID=471499 RepID=UPI000377072A|nr:Re/Si-specific NAD(P)(+) transhydrogenase subunit alpha [Dasania marina]
MLIVIPKETLSGERRASLVPDSVKKLVRAGADVSIEAGMGIAAGFSDSDYKEAGASINTDRQQLLASADIVLRLHKPTLAEVDLLKPGSTHISFLDPFNERELVEKMAAKNVSAISMEMIPRITRSQKMDALSSQANLAGYVMVLKAANALNRIFAMMMTPAGTLKPAKVFIIGAGVAGLQAIATAKRLGAKVTAFDTRDVVAEQVESLGAKFLKIDLGETGQTKEGYALALTPEQMELQKQGQKAEIAESDVVITTAQLFGRKPPVIVAADAVAAMKPGSVVVDMAAENGGNVEGSAPGETVVTENGVHIVGTGNWASDVPRDASQMYSSNLFNLVDEFWDEEAKTFALNFDNEIATGCVITHQGAVVNDVIKNHYNKTPQS